MKRLAPEVYKGINRAMTPGFDRWAKRHYHMSGKRLVAKVFAGEGGGTAKHPNISSAGARGPGQFIPSTRASFIKQFGIDPWRTNTEAAKGTMIHLQRYGGVRGYNPGMPSYERYILGQNVDTRPLRTGRYGSGALRGAVGAARGGGGGGGAVVTSPTTVSRASVQPGGLGLVPLLKEMQAQEKQARQPVATPLAPPAFSAQAAMPRGYQALESGPPPPEKTPISELLALVEQGGTVPHSVVTPGTVSAGGGSGGGGGGGGGRAPRGRAAQPMVQFAPGADRPGAPTSKHIGTLLRRASSWGGVPIVVGTGSNHKKFTTTGNVSDHYSGMAADINNIGGKNGNRIAGALLVELGVPRKRAREIANRGTAFLPGGTFTTVRHGRRWQLIWKSMTGGNHFNHVHIGFHPV